MQVLAFSHDANMLVLAPFFIHITIYKQQNVKKDYFYNCITILNKVA